jgi:hypothetical protein
MGLFDFFDYTPKSFLKDDLSPKEPIEILNMKENKVKNNFDEKYKDDETYQKLDKKTKDSIFLLRVLKKGLKQEDKQHVLSICFDYKDTASNNKIMEQSEDPYSKYNKTTERTPSMKPSQQRKSSIKAPTMQAAPQAAAPTMQAAAPTIQAAAPTMQAAAPTMQNNGDDGQTGGNRKRGRRSYTKKKTNKKNQTKRKVVKKY